jgi:deoxyribonuclease-4
MLDMADEMGVEALQMFVRNPRGMAAREITAEAAATFRSRVAALKIDPVVVHIPYISNPASVKPDLYALAERIIREDLQRCNLLGAKYLVMHPGTATGGTSEEGILRLGALLKRILADYEGETMLLIETMSGQGSEIGRDLGEIRAILDECGCMDRVGVCLDTCHFLAAGYALDTEEGIEAAVREVKDVLGENTLKVIHANDSVNPCGSHKDRHAPVGEGVNGLEGFRRLMKNEYLAGRAFIVETPTQSRDVAILKGIRQELDGK